MNRTMTEVILGAILKTHWPRALSGDLRSAEVCSRVLSSQAKIKGLSGPEAAL